MNNEFTWRAHPIGLSAVLFYLSTMRSKKVNEMNVLVCKYCNMTLRQEGRTTSYYYAQFNSAIVIPRVVPRDLVQFAVGRV